MLSHCYYLLALNLILYDKDIWLHGETTEYDSTIQCERWDGSDNICSTGLDLGYGGWSTTQCRGSEWSVVTIIVQSLCSHIKITLYGYSLLQCNALIVQNCGNSSGPKTGNVAISSLGHMVICPNAMTRVCGQCTVGKTGLLSSWIQSKIFRRELQKYLENIFGE